MEWRAQTSRNLSMFSAFFEGFIVEGAPLFLEIEPVMERFLARAVLGDALLRCFLHRIHSFQRGARHFRPLTKLSAHLSHEVLA